VQPHLRKCFDNLVKLRFGDSDKPGAQEGEALVQLFESLLGGRCFASASATLFGSRWNRKTWLDRLCP
jgi:hypothetical protein